MNDKMREAEVGGAAPGALRLEAKDLKPQTLSEAEAKRSSNFSPQSSERLRGPIGIEDLEERRDYGHHCLCEKGS